MCHSLYYHCHSDLSLSVCSFKSMLSLSFSLCVSLSALTVCVSVFLLSPCLCACVSVSGHRLSQGSPPRLPALLRQRAALPMPLCSPPVWLFTASSVSISTAAPLLTKVCSRRTGKGHRGACVQWVRHIENPKSRSLPHCHCLYILFSSACFPALPFCNIPNSQLRACALVSHHSKMWLIARLPPLFRLKKHLIP